MGCTTCKKSTSNCCCNKKRFSGAVDYRLVPGPQGEQGEQGIQGIQGEPGASGGIVYENYINQTNDVAWLDVLTAIVGTNHSVTADGLYQVHVDVTISVNIGASGFLYLYVGGAEVVSKQIGYVGGALSNNIQNVGLNWRGNVLNGQVIELRAIRNNANQIVDIDSQILINKEP
jgi:hypothetical protein